MERYSCQEACAATLDPHPPSSKRYALPSLRGKTDNTGRKALATLSVITFGTFDVLHVGHLSILKRARGLGNKLIVGVSSDQLNMRKKNRFPVFAEHQRAAIVGSLKCVDEVFIEESLELKREYISKWEADILVMGDDWSGRFDDLTDLCQVTYLPRTPSISTSAVIEKITNGTGPDLER